MSWLFAPDRRGSAYLRSVRSMTNLVERQPDDLARTVAAVAVSRLGEGIGKLPFLLLVAPLGGGVGDDIVGVAIVADRRGPGGRHRSPVGLLRRFLPGVKRIEK
jgi:hypothetical protein